MADAADDHHHQQNEATARNLNKTTTATSMANVPIAPAATHPLQDVNLNQDDVDFVREMPAAAATALTAAAKGNWVKFDDDVNEIEVNNENSIKQNDNLNNNNNITGKVISFIDNEKNDTRATTTQAIPKAATTTTTSHQNEATTAAASLETKNKLSSLLPPPPQPAQRSRTPTTTTTAAGATTGESKQEQQQRSRARTPEQQTNRTSATPTTITTKADIAPAVLSTESTHVNLNASGRTPPPPQRQLQQQQQHQKSTKAASSGSPQQKQQQQHHSNNNGSTSSVMAKATSPTSSNITIPVDSAPGMRTIELPTGRVQEGFANGDVIVTLLPANTKWPWITPAIFRPELVPEELMAQGLTLTVEEYVQAMETLVNDYRFTFYNICYKRILVCWIFFAFSVLLTLLFSGLQGVALFSLGVGWLFLNAAAIFLCMWAKLRLSRGLEKCLARVNTQLMKHKILLVLDDRGRISCHKVNLCFLYFDATLCVEFLNQFLEHTAQNGGEAVQAGWERKLDIDLNDIVIQGSNPVRLSRKQALAQELFLSYLQRWGKDYLRRRLDFTVQEAGVHERPRHLQNSICPCQYEEEVLTNKIKVHSNSKRCLGVDCVGCWM